MVAVKVLCEDYAICFINLNTAYNNTVQDKANQTTDYYFLVSHFYISMRAGGHYSLFIIQYYGILKVWFPGTAQIIILLAKRGVAGVSRQ